jgi:hypothetical protein
MAAAAAFFLLQSRIKIQYLKTLNGEEKNNMYMYQHISVFKQL